MTYSRAQMRATNKWNKENYDRITTQAPKGTKDRWKAEAENHGKSLNRFIIDAVEKEIKQNND